MSDLDSLLNFTKLMTKLATTNRFINKPGTSTRENLSEHCTQLAFTAWYIIEKYNLSLDKELVFMYALIHDISEAYTGDFPTHLRDFNREEKKRQENDALEQIKRDYAEVPNIWQIYQRYERKEDPECIFIYSLDKLLPALNIYLDAGKAWHERGAGDTTWGFAQVTERITDTQVSALWKELEKRVPAEFPNLIVTNQEGQ